MKKVIISITVCTALMLMSGLFIGASSAWAAPFTILGTHDFSGVNSEIDVDPVNDLVYLSAGMGQSGITRFDVSNPASITSAYNINPGWGGGIGVNPTTGNYASTNGFGGQVSIFDPMMATLGTASLTG